MEKSLKLDSFGHDRAKSYDQGNAHLAPILENLQYLIHIILNELSPNSKILCVGSGTGREIVDLAESFPHFTFVAIEPSVSMMEVCREKLRERNLLHRCDLIVGDIQQLGATDQFDAAICLLVLHHTSKKGRIDIVDGVIHRLKSSGIFISAELSFDDSLNSHPDLIEKWKTLIRKSGASSEKIESLPRMMKDHLFVHTPAEVEDVLEHHGFFRPVAFFQSLLIRAWYCRKP